MHRYLFKLFGVKPRFKFARSFLKPIATVQAFNSSCHKNWHSYTKISLTKTPQFFFTTKQGKDITEDISDETSLESQEKNYDSSKISAQDEVNSLPQSVSQNLAQEILSVIRNDYSRLYHDKELSKSPLYRLLFQEGVSWDQLITSNPQMSMAEGELRDDKVSVFFPNSITQQIFQICESLNHASRILITAQQGQQGLDYELALYVYLKRKEKNCRVFYIHNSQEFIFLPFFQFERQFKVAFEEELKVAEIQEAYNTFIEYRKKIDSQDNDKLNAIDILMKTLNPELKKKKIKVYLIVDQVNEFKKLKNKLKAQRANNVLDSFDLLDDILNIHVASKTLYEDATTRSQERPERELTPSFEIDDSIRSYIKFLAKIQNRSISEDVIQAITKVTGYIPLEVRMFFQFIEHESDIAKGLKAYKEWRRDLFENILYSFLEWNEDHWYSMTLALEALMTNGPYNPSLKRDCIDQRLLFIDTVKKRVFALTPLVKEGLKNMIVHQANIGETISIFKDNAAVLGFLLEIMIHKFALKWLYSSEFYEISSDDQKKPKSCFLIESETPLQNFQEEFSSNIFDVLKHNGYHNLHPTFPAIDGILVQTNKIALVQIKRTNSDLKKEINFFEETIRNFLNQKEEKPTFEAIKRNPTVTEGVTREEIIRFLLFEAIQKKKDIDIVFIAKKVHAKRKGIDNHSITVRFLTLEPMKALKKAELEKVSKLTLCEFDY